LAALPSQSFSPAPQAAQAPAVQVWLMVQAAVAQVVPQLASVLVIFSQPLTALLSQSSVPAPHTAQTPALQV
jgi:hypothetical protein